MQRPTLTNVRVSSTRDALQIFYAVARGVLPMITRRLDAEERRAIVPGNVYIWEERCANAEVTGLGMERWTDGISWSASRIAQEFLFYRQRDTDPESNQSSAHWANIMRRDPRSSGSPRSEVDRLIKQTFSVHVSLPDDRPRGLTRKWHLTAYFSQATLDGLSTIDMIPGVGDVSVPPGWFKNARASKGRAGERPRDESPPSWPESWAGVEVPTDPFRPLVYPREDKGSWGSTPIPTSSSHGHGNQSQSLNRADPHHHHQHHHHQHHQQHHHPLPPSSSQEYYPTHADYPRHPAYFHGAPPPPTSSNSSSVLPPTTEGYRDPSPSPFPSQSSSLSSSSAESSPVPVTPSYAASLPPPPPPAAAPSPHSSSHSSSHSSASLPPPVPHTHSPRLPSHTTNERERERSLVPLAVLKTIHPPVRDPMAEECLRRLSNGVGREREGREGAVGWVGR